MVEQKNVCTAPAVAAAAAAAAAALYPIDTIKTRLQAMIGGGGIKALLSSGGGKGLYAGVWGNLAGAAGIVQPSVRALRRDQQQACTGHVRAFCYVLLSLGRGQGAVRRCLGQPAQAGGAPSETITYLPYS
jgi:hypothetical protein